MEIDRHAIIVDEGRFYQQLGETFRRLRVNHSLTQEDVAQSLGLTRTSVTNIEKGNQKILVHTLIAAAGIFGVAPAELLNTEKTCVAISLTDDVPRKARHWIQNALIGVNQP